MSRIYIDDSEEEPVTEIAWINSSGDVEYIDIFSNSGFCFDVNSSEGEHVTFSRTDIPKLIKALEKAMELGWHKA